MIQSMTGYGKATATFGEKKINVEIKSLNSKAMDLSTRIAPLYREKEMEIRNLITQTLERGKVDFSLWVEKEAAEAATPINAALVENYYKQIKSISENCQIPLTSIMTVTDIILRIRNTLRFNLQTFLLHNLHRIVYIQLEICHNCQMIPRFMVEFLHITQVREHTSHNIDDSIGTALSFLSVLYRQGVVHHILHTSSVLR